MQSLALRGNCAFIIENPAIDDPISEKCSVLFSTRAEGGIVELFNSAHAHTKVVYAEILYAL